MIGPLKCVLSCYLLIMLWHLHRDPTNGVNWEYPIINKRQPRSNIYVFRSVGSRITSLRKDITFQTIIVNTLKFGILFKTEIKFESSPNNFNHNPFVFIWLHYLILFKIKPI